jgi:uncharacterized protein YebE (UPF0316 family)
MDAFLGALLIFCLRLCDVSVGTLRTVYVVRGDRVRATPLAFVESLIWVIAISKIMSEVNSGHSYNILAYAAGYAAGVFAGITIERWIASGWVLVRVITQDPAMTAAVRDRNFGVTEIRGEGRAGAHALLFIVAPRRRGNELLELIRSHEQSAFVTVDPVNTALGGYLPVTPRFDAGNATALRK